MLAFLARCVRFLIHVRIAIYNIAGNKQQKSVPEARGVLVLVLVPGLFGFGSWFVARVLGQAACW